MGGGGGGQATIGEGLSLLRDLRQHGGRQKRCGMACAVLQHVGGQGVNAWMM